MFNRLYYTLLLIIHLVVIPVSAVGAEPEQELRIVTGRSSYSLVIESLAEGFNKQYPEVIVKVLKMGTMLAMRTARKGDVDILISYHRDGERELLKEDVIKSRIEFMFSSYAIFGPPDDQLNLQKETAIKTVLRKLSESGSTFIISSKKGGNYHKMTELWSSAGIVPDGKWYDIIDTTTLSVMRIAAEQEAYTMGDSYNYFLKKDEFSNSLVPLYQGGYELHKPFSILTVNHRKNSRDNSAYAETFVDFVLSDAGQQIINKANKDIFNAPVFFPAVNFNPSAIAKRENIRLQKTNRSLYIVTGLLIVTGGMFLVVFYFFFQTRYFRKEKMNAEIDKGVAELANKTKSDFLSRMSHELRTPLNAILGFSQILEMKEKDQEKKRHLQDIVKAGQHLHHLINDILEITNIDSDRVGIEISEVSIGEIIDDCIVLCKKEINENDISLSFKGDMQSKVLADPLRLKEVLLNLITNAIKYNKLSGKIIIEAKKIDNQRLRVSITDSGQGISEDKQVHLFEPFERLGMELSGIEGTGIGLVICKSLMELMSGDIGYISTLGKGSTFWIEIKLA